MSGRTEHVRAVSKTLLGSRYRLETAAAIAAGAEVTYAREIAKVLDIADNQVQTELRHFQTAGLLDRLARVEGQRQQYYRRKPSHFWELAIELLAELAHEAGRS